jgi:uncharacterized cupin superfamily protein
MGIETGDGYAVGNIDDMGEGPGIRKVRRALDVTAFGVNVMVLPEGYASNHHYHDEQQELYFVHAGELEMTFGDGTAHVLKAGGLARVNAAMSRQLKNVGSGEAVYFCAGGKDGYVGRDGHTVEAE